MKAPSTTASDFDSCCGSGVSAFPTSATLSFPARRLATRLGILALLAATMTALSAGTAWGLVLNPNQTASFGTDGTSGTSFPSINHIALDQTAKRLYVLGFGPPRIYGLSVASPGSYAPVGGSFPLTVSNASGDAADIGVDNSGLGSNGNIYYASGNNSNQGFTSSGTPVAGWDPLFSGGCGIGVDPGGFIWLGAYNSSTIEKRNTAGALLSSFSVSNPCLVAFDSNGDLYYDSHSNSEPFSIYGPIHKRTASSGYSVATEVDPEVGVAIAVDRTRHNLYVAHSNRVDEYNSDGALIQRFATDLPNPNFKGVAVNEADGTVFVSDANSGKVLEYAGVLAPDATVSSASNVTTTTATLSGHVEPAGGGVVTDCRFEYGTISFGLSVPCEPATPYAGGQDVTADLTGLRPGATYRFRLTASNANASSNSLEGPVFNTPGPPSINRFSSSNLTATSVDLTAEINPKGTATTYRFVYGPTLDYGSSAPSSGGSIGGDFATHEVTAHLTGLSGITYHYAVEAENENGTTITPDGTFEFYPPNCPNAHLRQQTGAGYVPDCRAYELVSPGVVRSTLLGPEGPSTPYATNPSRFAYSGHLGVIEGTGEPTGQGSNIYVSTRTTAGWVSRYTGLRGSEGIEAQGSPDVLHKAEGPFGSRTLDRVMDWESGQQGFACCGDLGSFSPFLWDHTGAFISRLPTNIDEIPDGTADVTEGGFRGDGVPSADFSHYFFSSNNVAFTPGGLTTGPGSAYDNNLETGEVTLISKTSQGLDIPGDSGSADEYIRFPGVSVDGSHAVMSTEAPGGESHLYLSIDASEFIDLSADEGGVNRAARYEGMTDDGKTIYLSSTANLTADDTDTSRDLYAWREDQDPHLSRISQGTGGTGNLSSCSASWINGCGVEVVEIFHVGEFGMKVKATDNAVAANSGDVYFYSPELLDNGEGAFGQRNLYVYRDGQPRYVAAFSGTRLANRIQVSPDGDHMAFVTAEQLTTYDNAGMEVMYSYDPATRDLRCVSCIPDGTPPSFNVEASQNGLFMSNDGRTFFATKDALVPRDANGLWDTYEFVDSRPQLISSGTASADMDRYGHAGLVGVSADGTDVYFATLETLVPTDRNGPFLKFYDARTGGGFVFDLPPAPCVAADECHGPSSGPPAAPTMGTSANLGDGGNAKAVKKKKKKHAKKKHKKRTTKHRRHAQGERGRG